MNWFRALNNATGRKMRKRHRKKHCRYCHQECIALNDTRENQKYLILANPDKKTNEMGMHAGAIVTVKKNHESDSNIIVAIGEARYIIPRDLARRISVK